MPRSHDVDDQFGTHRVYLYRAIDQFGQVIDVLVSQKRDLAATRRFFTRALEHGPRPSEMTTDRAPAYPRVLDELLPAARHVIEQYANNPLESDHGRLKARVPPMRGLKRLRSARVISTGHAFIQNLRRGHYELGVDTDPKRQLRAAFTELALAIRSQPTQACHARIASTQQRPQEFSPARPFAARGGVDAGSFQDQPHGAGRKPVTKPGKFAVDPPIPPG